MHNGITRRSSLLDLTGGIAALSSGRAQALNNPVLIKNARIFDGEQDELRSGHIFVSGRKIKQISTTAITPEPSTTVIDAQGHFLIPWTHGRALAHGDGREHHDDLEQADTGLMYANAVAEAQRTVLRGFTTVRDMAGRPSASFSVVLLDPITLQPGIRLAIEGRGNDGWYPLGKIRVSGAASALGSGTGQ